MAASTARTRPARAARSPTKARANATRSDWRRGAERFKQIADATRLQVLMTLASGERNVSDLCEGLATSQPAVSHHLALLRHSGIIAPRRDGKHNLYSLTPLGRELAEMARTVCEGN